MKTIRNFLFVFLQAIGFFAIGQKQNNIRFEHLGIDHGLSQSNVICVLQDSRGFMWFGTRDGLNKYDGYKFTVYKNNADDKNSISNNYIQAIKESKSGYLWIATRGGGLNRYDRQKNLFTSFKHDPKNKYSISSNIVNTVLEDSQGNVWIGTEDGGLSMFDPEKNQFITYTYNRNNNKSLSDVYVRDILEDSQQNLWIATNNGGLNLFNRENNSFTRFQHNENNSKSISSNNLYTLFEDSKHRFWIGTNGGGLDLLNRESGEFYHYKHDPNNANSLANDYVHAINEDRNNLWIGTENGGLSILDPSENVFTTYTSDEFDNSSLSNNSIYSICKDNKSNIWIGTFNAGLNIVNRDAVKFTHYKHIPFKNSLSYNKVLSIYEDSNAGIWVTTDGGGLDFFDPNTSVFTNYRHQRGNKNSICGDYVLSVHEDYKNNLWIGTWADGITVFNRAKNSFKHFKNNPADKSSLSSNNAWMIFEDRDKNMWIATHGGGLNLYNPDNDSFTNYQYDENDPLSLSNNNVHSIFEDSEGYLWISTEGGGLNRFDKKKKTFTRFIHDDKKKNSISNNTVGAVYEDGNGMLWISTMVGLNSLDRKTNIFAVYTTKDGLPNNTIFGFLEDDNKNLWISTNKGISKFNTSTKTFKNFGVADGLQSNEFKEQAYCKSRNGIMYFGGNNGFNQFSPDSIRDIAFDPPLMITGFQVFNKDVAIADENSPASPLKKDITETKEVTLSYESSVISFEFASLNYTSTEKKQYAYMLEGFDKTWNEVGTKRTATYTNLDPGKYQFKVKGLNNDGSWSSAVTGIQLTITPPFWKTWWFRLLVGISIVGLVIALHGYRMRAVNKQKETLVGQVAVLDAAVAKGKFEVASDVMHDIGNAVVGFGSYMTRIKRLQQEDNPENLQKLAGFFKVNQPAMATAIGDAKAGAVVNMLHNINETQKSHQHELSNSITEQLHIIANIQEILNIQRQYITGRQTELRKPVSLQSVTNNCISILFALIDKMSIAVTLDFTVKQPIVKGDRTKLTQLMLHVLKNSIDAIDINTAEKSISVSIYTQADKLVIQVKDSGQGFDESVADQLFKRGFTTKFSGTGQSLHNCRTIAESHEGTIDIASEGPGKGAITTISFKI